MALGSNLFILDLLAYDRLMTVSVEMINQNARIYLRTTLPYDKMIYRRAGKYFPSVVFARSEYSEVCIATTSGQSSPVRPSRSVRALKSLSVGHRDLTTFFFILIGFNKAKIISIFTNTMAYLSLLFFR